MDTSSLPSIQSYLLRRISLLRIRNPRAKEVGLNTYHSMPFAAYVFSPHLFGPLSLPAAQISAQVFNQCHCNGTALSADRVTQSISRGLVNSLAWTP
jgi:hypothetical protein